MLKILVTGSRGQLGREINSLATDYPYMNFQFYDVDKLDITKEAEVNSIISSMKPDYIINCAGYTAVDKAESDTDQAYSINSFALNNIVSALQSANKGRLIHISTDFVFDGEERKPYSEDNTPLALSVYGESKLLGEKFALGYIHSMVIRTSWLYSEWGKNFVKTIIRLDNEKDLISVINDQIGTPTYAGDLAAAILKIIDDIHSGSSEFLSGIFHYSNEGECSWYDFALAIKKAAKLKLEIKPVSADNYPLPAQRPQYSVLNKEKIKKKYNLLIPQWDDSLKLCLKKLNASENEK